MKRLWVCIYSILLSGCLADNDHVLIVNKYWQAIEDGNIGELENILSDTEDLAVLERMKLDWDSFTVKQTGEEGVLVSIKRFCYQDLTFKTELVDVQGSAKVDSSATLKSLLREAATKSEPIKKYCYGFDIKPLSGKIGGQDWVIKNADHRIIDFGGKKANRISLYTENCDVEYTGECKLPKLIVSNLNFEGDGGNFSVRENITIHTPPSNNQIISKGSYRITPLNDGTTKLEISFNHDEQNHLNGAVILQSGI